MNRSISKDVGSDYGHKMRGIEKSAAFADSSPVSRFSKAKTVAERLDVCPRTIFRWADEGKIIRHKINARVVLFDEAEIAAFIKSSRVVAR